MEKELILRNRMRQIRVVPRQTRAGRRAFALPFALMLTVLVLILGLVFLEMGGFDAVRANEDVQWLQATTAAEYGIALARAMAISQSLPWVDMTYNGTPLSTSPGFGISSNPVYGNDEVCTLFNNLTVPSSASPATYTTVIQDLTGDLITSGTYRIHGWGTCGPYTRHVTADCQTITFASFLWLTNSENGVYFQTGNVLNGPAYTNGQFNIYGDPTFVQHVWTASSTLNDASGVTDNPNFEAGITYNAPKINFTGLLSSGQITAIQSAAKNGGINLPSNGGKGYTITFGPVAGQVTIAQSQSGGTTLYNAVATSSFNGAIYATEPLSVSGTVGGQITIGTSQTIDITGNIQYSWPSNPATMFQSGFNQSNPLLVDKLALIAAGNVMIDRVAGPTCRTRCILPRKSPP